MGTELCFSSIPPVTTVTKQLLGGSWGSPAAAPGLGHSRATNTHPGQGDSWQSPNPLHEREIFEVQNSRNPPRRVSSFCQSPERHRKGARSQGKGKDTGTAGRAAPAKPQVMWKWHHPGLHLFVDLVGKKESRKDCTEQKESESDSPQILSPTRGFGSDLIPAHRHSYGRGRKVKMTLRNYFCSTLSTSAPIPSQPPERGSALYGHHGI